MQQKNQNAPSLKIDFLEAKITIKKFLAPFPAGISG
jgi:hypothetical protein